MAYIDVLPLAEMKIYLRIDDDQNETDSEITSMIKSAFRYIERTTNIMVVQYALKEFIVENRCVRVYDHPINAVIKGLDDDDDDVTLVYKDDFNRDLKSLYTLYNSIDINVEKLVLDVGYLTATDVPDDVVQIAKEMVKVMFFEQETDKSFHQMLAPSTREVLESLRRFVV